MNKIKNEFKKQYIKSYKENGFFFGFLSWFSFTIFLISLFSVSLFLVFTFYKFIDHSEEEVKKGSVIIINKKIEKDLTLDDMIEISPRIEPKQDHYYIEYVLGKDTSKMEIDSNRYYDICRDDSLGVEYHDGVITESKYILKLK